MDVQITDSGALRRISTVVLNGYLESQGWNRQQSWKNRVVVWAKTTDGRSDELLVPIREQSDAYTVRISEVLTTLAELESRSQIDIYYDVLGAGCDIVRVRSLNGNGQVDWSLSDSVDLLARARDLLTAAARAAERPGQAVYRGRLSGVVTDYVRSVRPLPNYETSRDLTLHSRVSANYDVQSDMGDSFTAPFARQAIRALDFGLREAESVTQRVLGGESLSSFDGAAQSGANANLCEAIAGLVRQTHGMEVGLSWAAVRPYDESDHRFAFGQSYADVLTDGAHRLRQNSPFVDAHISGDIVRLDRESQQDFDGHAVVLCELDGRPIALHVQFDLTDRESVLRAFRDSLEISFDGDIVREGRHFRLKGLRNFSLVSSASPE